MGQAFSDPISCMDASLIECFRTRADQASQLESLTVSPGPDSASPAFLRVGAGCRLDNAVKEAGVGT
jgi:hypothetical protein